MFVHCEWELAQQLTVFKSSFVMLLLLLNVTLWTFCREDGKDSMKFYTDPTYFFELWCHEMQKDTEQQKKELKQRRKNRVTLCSMHIALSWSCRRLSRPCYVFNHQIDVVLKHVYSHMITCVCFSAAVRWNWCHSSVYFNATRMFVRVMASCFIAKYPVLGSRDCKQALHHS